MTAGENVLTDNFSIKDQTFESALAINIVSYSIDFQKRQVRQGACLSPLTLKQEC